MQAGQASEQAEGCYRSQAQQHSAQGQGSLAAAGAELGEFDPIAMAWPRIHLDLSITAGALRQGEGQATLGIGAAQLDRRSALGDDQPHGGITGRLAIGEGALQLHAASTGRQRRVGMGGMATAQ